MKQFMYRKEYKDTSWSYYYNTVFSELIYIIIILDFVFE